MNKQETIDWYKTNIPDISENEMVLVDRNWEWYKDEKVKFGKYWEYRLRLKYADSPHYKLIPTGLEQIDPLEHFRIKFDKSEEALKKKFFPDYILKSKMDGKEHYVEFKATQNIENQSYMHLLELNITRPVFIFSYSEFKERFIFRRIDRILISDIKKGVKKSGHSSGDDYRTMLDQGEWKVI